MSLQGRRLRPDGKKTEPPELQGLATGVARQGTDRDDFLALRAVSIKGRRAGATGSPDAILAAQSDRETQPDYLHESATYGVIGGAPEAIRTDFTPYAADDLIWPWGDIRSSPRAC
jgi:hypothetical protein